jgi:cyclophilin family peptidyl-prolyl cis-trans isomerase
MNDKECSYKGSEVHRIVPGMYIQTGRVDAVNEQGAASSFGDEFADESFCIKHTAAGMVGMCKRAGLKHTNETQFYVTTGAPLDFLDGENVVFGRIVQGFSTIESIEKL